MAVEGFLGVLEWSARYLKAILQILILPRRLAKVSGIYLQRRPISEIYRTITGKSASQKMAH